MRSIKTNLFLAFIFLFAVAEAQVKQAPEKVFNAADRPKNLSDTALLELVQKQTFKYFWDFAHPVSGMARERSNIAYEYGNEVVTTGGTGFGIMAIVVGAERKWITCEQAVDRLLRTVLFLSKA